jgi:hypothetical protein
VGGGELRGGEQREASKEKEKMDVIFDIITYCAFRIIEGETESIE